MISSATVIRAGVMAWPVSHSLSPSLHRHWLKTYAINGTYDPIAVTPTDFPAMLRSLPARGFSGVNVTLPHKIAALEGVDTLDDVARRTGAVNTVIVKEDGTLHGFNTDVFGFMANIADVHPDWVADAGPAVVLGAGGAARAVCVALQDAGAPEIRILNRTVTKAEDLATGLGSPLKVFDWRDRHDALREGAFLVNTTSLGMTGMAPLELDLTSLPPDASVCDVVYTPLETPLLADARARGNPTIDGLGMLLHQAKPGFEAWFGRAPDVTENLRQVVLDAMGQ
ncbi:MAG: shikimate dehydrogenase [Rhodospirillaceae bacterium]|nr:shikimate dehydrogenase [Rhodospirillaceae bacterium]